jgi:hypothetical protein
MIDPKIPHFPLRSNDLIEKDLEIDPDDIYDLLSEDADRAGYDLSECESNPYFGKIKTIADFVLFISHQPKNSESPSRVVSFNHHPQLQMQMESRYQNLGDVTSSPAVELSRQ